jgi:hypothetical protein
MKKLLCLAMLAAATSLTAAPLFPVIAGHDINFGAYNGVGGPPEWSMNGLAPDTLTYVPAEIHHEATAYWPLWPNPPVLPIFGGGGIFAGDFVLNVMFTGQDAPYVGPGGVIDVSLTGSGASPGAPDLMVFGSIGAPGPVILLWALDLDDVSLYGYSSRRSFVLEGLGTIVGGSIAEQNNLIGRPGAMRGQVDFVDIGEGPPPLYDPLRDPGQNHFRVDYSGETGLVPEPASILVITAGIVALLARRKTK